MKKAKLYKGHLLLYVILAFSTIGAMIMVKNCTPKQDIVENYIRAEDDTINVAIEISPLSYSMATDTIGGFYYDLLRLISRKFDVKFKYHKFVTFNVAKEGLEHDIFDIIVADIPVVSELKEKFLLTEPLFVDQQVLVQKKDVNILTEYNQLANDTIWIETGSTVKTRIHNLSKEIGCDTIYVIELDNSSEQLIMLTATGEIKRAVVNESIAKSMLKEYPQLDIKTKISFGQFQSWILKHNNAELCEKFNKWIIQVKDTEEYRLLYKRYFNSKK